MDPYHLIRIQGFNDQKLKKKITAEIFFFKSKFRIYLSLDLHNGFPSYRRSLQPSKKEHPTFNTSESGYGSTVLIKSGPDPNPGPGSDPKHRLSVVFKAYGTFTRSEVTGNIVSVTKC
jgi:hypothetical protein